MTERRDQFQELVQLEVAAAYDPETDRLLAPLGGAWWTLSGTDDLYNEDSVRALLAPGGWTLTGALTVLLYGCDKDDDGHIVPITCSDEQLEQTLARVRAFERRYWPVLAALGHELDHEDRPSVKRRGWLWAQAADDLPEPRDPGKWVIFRPRDQIDRAWEMVRGAVLIGRLYAAKCSSCDRADDYGGVHVVCVYCPDSRDFAAVREARAVLRALGIVEVIGFKTDRATSQKLTGDAEWAMRE